MNAQDEVRSVHVLVIVSVVLTLGLLHCYYSAQKGCHHSETLMTSAGGNTFFVTLLLVSDIHRCAENLRALKEFVGARKLHPDHVICPGDFHNLWEEDQQDKEKVRAAVEEVQRLLLALLEISPSVYYVPGNHDPFPMFYAPSGVAAGAQGLQVVSQAVSAQKRVLQLRPGLFITGFGGAPPGYRQSEEVWQGYPYHSQQAFQDEFDAFVEGTLLQQQPQLFQRKSVVVVTHAGPSFCSSTRDFSQVEQQQGPITSGADAVYTFLSKKAVQEKVVALIHGHTHYAQGCEWVGSVRVVNPGSASAAFGDFAVLTLKGEGGGGGAEWKVHNLTFYNIN